MGYEGRAGQGRAGDRRGQDREQRAVCDIQYRSGYHAHLNRNFDCNFICAFRCCILSGVEQCKVVQYDVMLCCSYEDRRSVSLSPT